MKLTCYSGVSPYTMFDLYFAASSGREDAEYKAFTQLLQHIHDTRIFTNDEPNSSYDLDSMKKMDILVYFLSAADMKAKTPCYLEFQAAAEANLKPIVVLRDKQCYDFMGSARSLSQVVEGWTPQYAQKLTNVLQKALFELYLAASAAKLEAKDMNAANELAEDCRICIEPLLTKASGWDEFEVLIQYYSHLSQLHFLQENYEDAAQFASQAVELQMQVFKVSSNPYDQIKLMEYCLHAGKCCLELGQPSSAMGFYILGIDSAEHLYPLHITTTELEQAFLPCIDLCRKNADNETVTMLENRLSSLRSSNS